MTGDPRTRQRGLNGPPNQGGSWATGARPARSLNSNRRSQDHSAIRTETMPCVCSCARSDASRGASPVPTLRLSEAASNVVFPLEFGLRDAADGLEQEEVVVDRRGSLCGSDRRVVKGGESSMALRVCPRILLTPRVTTRRRTCRPTRRALSLGNLAQATQRVIARVAARSTDSASTNQGEGTPSTSL